MRIKAAALLALGLAGGAGLFYVAVQVGRRYQPSVTLVVTLAMIATAITVLLLLRENRYGPFFVQGVTLLWGAAVAQFNQSLAGLLWTGCLVAEIFILLGAVMLSGK